MAMRDFTLAKEFKKIVVKPSTKMYGVEQFDDGEMLLSPKGIVFLGKLQNNVQKKNMFCTNLKETLMAWSLPCDSTNLAPILTELTKKMPHLTFVKINVDELEKRGGDSNEIVDATIDLMEEMQAVPRPAVVMMAVMEDGCGYGG
ncbi:unnamed protein product [Lactuca virosa]|uniref:Uncharacterized protein n=1 Tax=Lactuca virosa TaxID=75947 RepID=A0AAU9MAE9_9ASTR|nr:unnamed protein product [Lactuca virosa]